MLFHNKGAFMKQVIYSVVFHRGKWRVKFHNKFYGAYRAKNDAITSARQAAEGSIADGLDAKVEIFEINNEWKLEWKNKGCDLFPFSNYKRAA